MVAHQNWSWHLSRLDTVKDCCAHAPGARSSGASAKPGSSGRGGLGGGSTSQAASQLWVEKHKPTSSAELVGNGTLVSTLRTFLQNWYAPLLLLAAHSCTAGIKPAPKHLAHLEYWVMSLCNLLTQKQHLG